MYSYSRFFCFPYVRIANGVLEKISPQLLSKNKGLVNAWISGMDGVLDKVGQDALLKLFKLVHVADILYMYVHYYVHLLLHPPPTLLHIPSSLPVSPLVLLFSHFVSDQNWSNLLVLLEQCPKAVTGLEPHLSQLVTCMVSQQPALSDRAATILEMMSNESLSKITAEVLYLV